MITVAMPRQRQTSPNRPFPISTKTRIAKKLSYPRAGVRQQHDGQWLLTLWFGTALWRIDDKAKTYDTRLAAIKDGQRETHAIRNRKHPAGQTHLRGISPEPTA